MPSISSSDSIYSIRKSILGDYSCIPTPLGPRKLTYADCTASGRSSSLIEKQINERVLPLSANTHTSSSYTGYSCHNFLDESRSIIRDSVNASITEDAVIFCGRGATAASNLLVHLIASTSPTTLSTTLSSSPSSVSCLKQQRKSKRMSATTLETVNSIKSTLDDDDTLLTTTSIDTDTIKNKKDKDKEEEEEDDDDDDDDDDPKSLLNTKYTSIESKKNCFSEKCSFPGCDRIFQIVTKKENTITVNDSKKRKTRFDSIYRMMTNLILHSRTHSDGEASANDAIRRLTTYQKKEEEEEEVEEEEHTLEDDDNDNDDINDDDVTDTNFHVIVGPFAHNSSYLPWKEFGAKITHIPSSSSSLGIDIFILLKTLRNIHKKKTLQNYQLICVLTSASNVTGQLCGTLKQKSAITALIHAYNGIVIWDYAATASHFPPEMNNSKQSVMSWNEICTLLGIKNIIMKKSLLTTSISLNKNQYIKNDDDNDDDIQCLIQPPSSSSSSSSSSTFSTKNDAIFFSMHKFVGGGGGGLPGVLVIKRSLLRHTRPNLPGGGTVFFVSNDGDALYTGIDEEREEGGTPDVAGCARASLCLLLCRQVGWETIRKREASIAAVARREWSNEPNIIVVGHTNVYKKKRRLNREENEEEEDDDDDDDNKSEAEAVPIISLFFKYQSHNLSSSSSSSFSSSSSSNGVFALHWGFVSAVLNDFFGIQCRGGCLCAGVFAQNLLGITKKESKELEQALLTNTRNELLRPGFVRISFSFYMSHAEIRYIIDAVKWVARYGHKILHLYTPIPGSGDWKVKRSLIVASLKRGRKIYLDGNTSIIQQVFNKELSMNKVEEKNEEIKKKEEEEEEVDEEEENDKGISRGDTLNQSWLTHTPIIDPHLVIKEYTEGYYNIGLFEAAKRGDIKSHPRSWLSTVSFFNKNNDTLSNNDKTNKSELISNTIFDDNISHTTDTDSTVKIICSEEKMYKLFDAYIKEADLILLGSYSTIDISRNTLESNSNVDDTIYSSSSSSSSSSVLSTNVLEPNAQHLRWFAISSDSIYDKKEKEEVEKIQQQCPWSLYNRVAAYSSSSSSSLITSDIEDRNKNTVYLTNNESKKKNEMTISSIKNTFEKILSTPSLLVSSYELQVWNGSGIIVDDREEEIETRSRNIDYINQVKDDEKKKIKHSKTRKNFNSSIKHSTTTDVDTILHDTINTSTTKPLLIDKQSFVSTTQSNLSIHSSHLETLSSTTVLSSTTLKSCHVGILVGTSFLDYRRSNEFIKTQDALQTIVGIGAVPASISRTLSHGLREAILDFNMIRNGDKILVGLSGGKDSMTLLLQLLRLQATAPVSFQVGAATVDPQSEGYNPRPLISWCESLGVPYFFESQPIIDLASKHMGKDSICAFCSRLKRGVLYSACRREGYNVLALGQHLDDFAESFVMSAFRNGILRTMKASYTVDKGDLRVIRPLVFLRENSTRAYAASIKLPIIPENCPACFTGPTERYKIKRLLSTESVGNPNLFNCLMRAMRPLMTSSGSQAIRQGRNEKIGEVGEDEEDENM